MQRAARYDPPQVFHLRGHERRMGHAFVERHLQGVAPERLLHGTHEFGRAEQLVCFGVHHGRKDTVFFRSLHPASRVAIRNPR